MNAHTSMSWGSHTVGMATQAAVLTGIPPDWEWAEFWVQVQGQLRRSGYRKTSRRLYRNVLRGFRSHSGCLPAEVTRRHIRDYLHHLGARRLSASWIGMNLSALRIIFDRIFGEELTRDFRAPKRPQRLPEILSPVEIRTLLDCASSPRDRELVGLIYGCGLRVGEVCRLRWKNLDPKTGSLHVRSPTTGGVRTLRLPRELVQILNREGSTRPPDGFVFTGRRRGSHLSTRAAERIVFDLATRGLPGVRVTSFSLRHAYAAHSLDAGMNIRELQEALGHLHIRTTMRYLRLLPPADAISPLDQWETRSTESDPIPSPTIEEPGDGPLGAEPIALPRNESEGTHPANNHPNTQGKRWFRPWFSRHHHPG